MRTVQTTEVRPIRTVAVLVSPKPPLVIGATSRSPGSAVPARIAGPSFSETAADGSPLTLSGTGRRIAVIVAWGEPTRRCGSWSSSDTRMNAG